ncbi:MAG: hypothetical protein R3Y19_07690 [Rikenellaceae bacterium]
MKKILFNTMATAIVAMFSLSSVNAQMRTPFEKVEIGEDGKRQYVYENTQLGKSSVSLFYGYSPANKYNWWASNTFKSQYSAQQAYSSETATNTGVFGLTYSNQITPWLELCFPFTYSYSTGNFVDFDLNNWSSEYYETILTFTPNVKISWLFNDLVHLYSRVGIGFAIANRYEDFNAGMNGKFGFTWQFSPVGIEVGRRVAFFAEAGIGHLGMVSAGLKIRFNRSDVRPDGTTREKREWYDVMTH